MVTLARRAARTPLAPVVAVMFGAVAAILMAAVPDWMFDRAVVKSGLPSLVSFAAPPLGMTARAVAVGLAGLIVGGLLWLILTQIEAMLKRARNVRAPWHDEGYSQANDTVKFEGRRRPIFAPAELGAPLMSDEAIAYAPALEPVFDHEPELEAPLSAVEFDLPPSDTPDDDDNSIQALIRRLESGLARRAANDPGPDSPTSVTQPMPLSSDWIVHDRERSHEGDTDGSDVRQFLGSLKKLASR
ncbi:MAG: hypothetical protein JWL66_2998 [Sphingomonadales bacterium]|nr:hypothetical protein [Sphingomonadales bacterium]